MGANDRGTISNSYATGEATGTATGSGTVHAGGLLGWSNGTISNSYATGQVTATSAGTGAGGLVGVNVGTISNSYATGEVTATGRDGLGFAGGLIGHSDGTITNSYATGEVTATSTGSGTVYAGGLAGWINGPIENCYATGEVTAIETGSEEVYAGGLVGVNQSTISNSYATGGVTGTTSSGNVHAGGLVGVNNTNTSTISNSYATGNVRGTTSSGTVHAGGLVGFNANSSTNSISNSYFNSTTTGQSAGIGVGTQTGVTALNTAGLQGLTSATGWSTNNWDFGNAGQYPALRSYKVNESNTQIQGELICGQPAPRANTGCPSIAFTTTSPAVISSSNTYDFGVVSDTGAILTYTITGSDFTGDITLALEGDGKDVFTISPTTITAGEDDTLSQTITVTFNPGAKSYEATIRHSGARLGVGVVLTLTGEGTPAEISTIEDLNNIRNNLDENYVLTKNLDFADAASYADSAANMATYTPTGGDPSMATNAGWAPIGDNADETDATHFTGSFDGGDFTISNLYVNISSADAVYAGLFGITGTGSKVQNLGVVNAYVKATGTGSGHVNAGGLVGGNGGTITNSYATGDVTATGESWSIGGLVGGNGGTITNSYATGRVVATGSGGGFVGGLAGSSGGTISNSYATGEVTGTGSAWMNAGGLVGLNHDGTISNSYAIGKVTITGSGFGHVGGLVGINNTSTSAVSNSYATGQVTETATGSGGVNVGGLAGGNAGTITNSYFNSTTTGQSAGVGAGTGTGVTSLYTAGLQRLTVTFTTWNAFNWDFGSTSQYPALRSYKVNDASPPVQIQGDLLPDQPCPRAECIPITISTIEDLNNIRNNLEGSYVLARNLDFADEGSYANPANMASYIPNNEDPAMATNPGWVPIGDSYSNSFTGSFDGGGFTISNLYVSVSAADTVYAGLFGVTGRDSKVQNLGIVDVYVKAEGTGRNYVYAGGLVGGNNSTISNSYAIGTVTAEGTGGGAVLAGGLTGSIDFGGSITNSYATGQVTATSTGSGRVLAGGLTGNNDISGTISNSYATGAVTATGTGNSYVHAGGLVGQNYGSTVSNSYATGQVTATSTGSGRVLAGGLTGNNDISGTISNSYATGAVTATGTGNSYVHAGGLVGSGSSSSSSTVSNSYATGEVTGSGRNVNVGGLMGHNDGTISNSYATGEVTGSGRNVNVGGLMGHNDGTISNSYATGNVTATDSGTVFEGGLAGYNDGSISNSYATGNVTATGSGNVRAGGLVGQNGESYSSNGSISNSYATGNVTATGSGTVYAGGLVGQNGSLYSSNGTISNSYATGRVTSTGAVTVTVHSGGLVGSNVGTISNSYFNSTTTGQSAGVGNGTQTGVTAATISLQALTATTAPSSQWSTNNWDFGTSSQYPALRSYKVNDASPPVQIQGELICPQPAPRANTGCPSIAFTTTPSTVISSSNTYDFGVVSDAGTTLTYTITGSDFTGDLTLALEGDGKDAFTISPTTITAGEDGTLSQAITVTFNPGAKSYEATIRHSGARLGVGVVLTLTGEGTPALISTIEDLYNIRNNLDENYVLTKNLDFADAASYASNTVNSDYTPNNEDPAMATNAGFVPIGDNSDGTDATRFTGSFDGGGFTISNLYVNISSANTIYAGLFGRTGTGSKVQNLGIVDGYVKATGTSTSEVYAGGLVGYSYGTATIENCYATGNATATGSGPVLVGGLVGHNDGTISNSYATGNVTGTGSGHVYAGGLVGWSNGTIENGYATGTVTATGNGRVYAGGLLGVNQGTISNSYATGDVATNAGSGWSSGGGLVGSNNTNTSTISNSYATGRVTSTGAVTVTVLSGGLAGYNSNGSISNSYFDSTSTRQSAGIGGGTLTGVTAATISLQALTATTAPSNQWSTNNWDFGTSSQYPALRSYKVNDASPPVQIQGDLICGQPAPRANTGCPSIAFTATLPAVISSSNTHDFGVVSDAGTTLTYTITGSDFTGDLTLTLEGDGKDAFTISPTTITPEQGGTLSQTITVTFNPRAKSYEATIRHSGTRLGAGVVLTLTGEGTPALISTIEELNNIRNNLDENYVLTKNLDFADAASYASNAVNTEYRPTGGDPSMATNAGWAPIGASRSNLFTGSFDGGGFTISNLYVNASSSSTNLYAGLFGDIGTGAEVQNLGMVNAYVKATATGSAEVYAGGLGGWNEGGIISNSYATGTVSATNTGSSRAFAGGLVGGNNSTISNSYAIGTVTAEGTGGGAVLAGGLVGWSNGTISNSHATGNTTATATATATGSGLVYAGGLLGLNRGTISNSYATGEVTATGNGLVYAGGLAGLSSSIISDSYATGEVTATGTGSGNVYAGGLVGNNSGTVSNSYAEVTGNISVISTFETSFAAGGLIGQSNNGTINNSYAVVTGNISSPYSTGGLVGEILSNSSISNSYAVVSGNISTSSVGDSRAGGLVGTTIGSSISNSYAVVSGHVSTFSNSSNIYSGAYVGGLAGVVGTSSINNVYVVVMGGVSSSGNRPTFAGGLIGVDVGSSSISASYYSASRKSSEGEFSNTHGTSQTPVRLRALTAAGTGWSELNWDFGTTSQYPALRSYKVNTGGTQIQGELICKQPFPRNFCDGDDPDPDGNGFFNISTIEDLNKIRNYLGGSYELTADIDLSHIANWRPIGDSTNRFTGSFDGNGYKISGVSSSGYQFAGLFGYVSSASISNVGVLIDSISSSSPSGFSNLGGLVGRADYSVISNSYVVVEGSISSIYISGGLVGRTDSSEISNSYAVVEGGISSSSSSDSYSGGLVGLAVAGGTISNSYAVVRGGISSSSSPGRPSFSGGLVGRAGSSIINSYAVVEGGISSSTSGNSYSGGLVGSGAENLISKSYYSASRKSSEGTFTNTLGTSQKLAELRALTCRRHWLE